MIPGMSDRFDKVFKKTVGRPKDLTDVRMLETQHGPPPTDRQPPP